MPRVFDFGFELMYFSFDIMIIEKVITYIFIKKFLFFVYTHRFDQNHFD